METFIHRATYRAEGYGAKSRIETRNWIELGGIASGLSVVGALLLEQVEDWQEFDKEQFDRQWEEFVVLYKRIWRRRRFLLALCYPLALLEKIAWEVADPDVL